MRPDLPANSSLGMAGFALAAGLGADGDGALGADPGLRLCESPIQTRSPLETEVEGADSTLPRMQRRARSTAQDCGGVHSRGLSCVTFFLVNLMKAVERLV